MIGRCFKYKIYTQENLFAAYRDYRQLIEHRHPQENLFAPKRAKCFVNQFCDKTHKISPDKTEALNISNFTYNYASLNTNYLRKCKQMCQLSFLINDPQFPTPQTVTYLPFSRKQTLYNAVQGSFNQTFWNTQDGKYKTRIGLRRKKIYFEKFECKR